MSDAVFLGLLGVFQAITIAYLEHGRRQAKKTCGDAPCVRAISRALNIKLAADQLAGEIKEHGL